jgi:hypothetical protein
MRWGKWGWRMGIARPTSARSGTGRFCWGVGECIWERGWWGGYGRFPWLIGLFPARETMAALRQVGVLDEVNETTEGLVVYPAGLVADGDA